jgi:uncharacterized protein (TIGR00369 family)
MATAKLSVKELERLLAVEFPHMFRPDGAYAIEQVWHGGCRVRRRFSERALRPGGTLSGATMMALADFAMYVAILGSIGWVPLAVTTNLNINFLRKPRLGALIAECRLLKLGKRLAVGEVTIREEGDEEPVAHATSTYSIPPQAKALESGIIKPKS